MAVLEGVFLVGDDPEWRRELPLEGGVVDGVGEKEGVPGDEP